MIDELNQSLRNSGDPYYLEFTQQGSLVNLAGYNENSGVVNPNDRFVGHLTRLREWEIGTFSTPPQAPRRETEGADFAILLVADQGNPTADPATSRPVWGVAIGQRNNCDGIGLCDVGDGVFPVPNFSYRDFAYGVVSVNPAAQNLTFAHEIGHMLGANHDANVQLPIATLRGAFPFSYGYRIPTVSRDIMADPRCVDTNADTVPDQCTDRQPQFSNPRVAFMGSSNPSGTATRDATRTITCLAEPSGNLYPLGDQQSAPNIFWSGFEAPGLAVSTCPPRTLWP